MIPFRAGCRFLSLIGLLMLPGVLPAQAVVYPPAPEKYEAHFRYRIRADRDERIRQYREMERHLKSLGFAATPKEDADLEIFDPTAEDLSGTIASAQAKRLLDDPRIQTVLLLPTGTPLAEDGKKPVQIRLTLSSGLAPSEQYLLHSQLARHLGLLGFREAIAYDHRGYTGLRGTIPTEHLFKLLKDARTQPSGWFLPLVSKDQLPLPLRGVMPVRLIEVLPDLPAVPEPAPVVGAVPASAKLTADARGLVENPLSAGKPVRVDLVLHDDPGAQWSTLRDLIRVSAEGVSVEGLIGNLVTIRVANAADVNKIANLQEVRSIRLTRSGVETAQSIPNATGSPVDWLTQARVTELHRLGYRGKGSRVVIVSSGFPYLIEAQTAKALPTLLSQLDLTAELSPEVQPAPMDASRPAGGTAAAIAVHAAAPDAELILVRVDPTAFHQLQTVARSAAGSAAYSEAMQSRGDELKRLSERLTTRRSTTAERYRKALADLRDDPKVEKEREAATAEFQQLIADEKVFAATMDRYKTLRDRLDTLKGAAVVVSTLAWDTGFPQDGMNDLSRYLDERFVARPVSSSLKAAKQPLVPVWVQPASPSTGQVWAGPFLDADGNGVMDFPRDKSTAPTTNRELNFLSYTPSGGATSKTLPAGARIRVTAQWREPHDPEGFLPREPVFPLAIRLLRQIDPEGKTVASDEFVEITRTTDVPVRLQKTTGSGTYEQVLEVTLPADGVYAIRLEGQAVFESVLASQRQQAEVYPRLVIDAADTVTAEKGRPRFATYSTLTAGVGQPGDAQAALTVGVRGANQHLLGAGPSVQLRAKPDVYAPGSIAVNGVGGQGVGVAAGYAAGVAASLRTAGVRATDFIQNLGLEPSTDLSLPADWLRSLVPLK